MNFSLHSLVPIFPLFCNCQLRKLPQFSAPTANSGTQPNSNSSCLRSSLYTLGSATTENTASSIVVCWFTAAETCLWHSCVVTSAERNHRKCRLKHLFYCYVTSQSTWSVPLPRVYGSLPSNGCLSASTVFALSKYTTIFWPWNAKFHLTKQGRKWTNKMERKNTH
jgi:hypothetical protein